MPVQPSPSPIQPSAAHTASARTVTPAAEPVTLEQGAARSPSAVPPLSQPPAPDAQPVASEALGSNPVDINAASADDLNRLGGRIGRAIIAGRPYRTIDELVSKRVITRSTFSQIKDQITVN